MCDVCVTCVGGVWCEDGLEALEDLTHSAAWQVVMAKVTTATPTRIQLTDTSGDKVKLNCHDFEVFLWLPLT